MITPVNPDVIADMQSMEGKAADILMAIRRVVEIARFLVTLPAAIKNVDPATKTKIEVKVQPLKELMEDLVECIVEFGNKGERRALRSLAISV